MNQLDYHRHLPPYRSLLNPNAKYDYQLHSLIPISQNELNNLKLIFMRNEGNQGNSQQKPTFKMKYKSLLNDVNRKISLKISNPSFLNSSSLAPNVNTPGSGCSPLLCVKESLSFKSLPIEIQFHVFSFLSKKDLQSTIVVNKDFYKLSKKFLYKNLVFDSSFRFAQFITILRINSKLGNLVETIDLSGLKPCDYDVQDDSNALTNQTSISSDSNDEEGELVFADNDKVKAGWRDWKFLRNPLYSSGLGLTRISSNSPSFNSNKSLNSNNKKKLKFSFLKSKRNKLGGHVHLNGIHSIHHQASTHAQGSLKIHPSINKFLINYSNTKDLPVGYVLHLLNMCPNLTSINLGNLQLSVDYEINPNFIYKFHTFDVIHNYPSSLLMHINDLDDSNSIYNMDLLENLNQRYDVDNMSMISSSSSRSRSKLKSINKSQKPVWKYNSLLTPMPNSNYLNKNDGKLYLSDLNLKSMNQNYLVKLNEFDILNLLIKCHKFNINFKYLNLSSMIWLNKKLIQNFFSKFLRPNYLTDLEMEFVPRNLVIDLTNSGMYKDLVWARKIDLNKQESFDILIRILKDELLNVWESRLREDRIRRGRMAENYLS
ncbi:hypothetical protein PSN45_001918 [Yamadazyma tenuis]|uniref:F-box domain-containing protein n=1 Tax=Candida tenuis (strain ATCC 10573 / BCRC 21748 / CBS 615 / JCM 9827 / NBRC 10315 / NRRL Y-1498 / VKM Y-70) TaxID=590646 RepID=G3BDL1_CANTC|nr:uncharacterized protein CANTEDRAFT_136807 [Yamadazyma tenuis ATCC 10573]EGV60326.1 hypothetical protein CANTEDRAFT_136807 [Yamadazyma tenuis ATCC 10573]WEJ94434.1 hypothetical protein PSN45_001918 [Yamadazyma tenuis]